MKKSIVLLTSLILSALTLAACGTSSGGETSSGSATTGGTISFWAYQPSEQSDQDAFKKMITDFTTETGIQVKLNLVVKDSYNTALNSALTSRSKPDMAYLDQPLISDYATKNKIVQLDSLVKDNADFASTRFFDGAYNTCLYQGKLYGLPLNMTSTVLFYNTDLVSAAPTTWAQWLNTSVSGTNSLFDGIGTGGYAGWYFQCFLANNGGSLMSEDLKQITFNNDKGIEAATMMQNLYTFDNAQATTNRNSSNAFGRGVVAYRLGSSSDIDTLDTNFPNLNYNVALMPTKDEGATSASNMGGENLVVFQNSSNQASCLKLFDYLMKKENISKVSGFTGNFPAIKEYATTDSVPVVKEASRAKKGVILTQMAHAVGRPVIPGWIDVNDNYLGVQIADTILSSDSTKRANIKGALDTAASAAQQVLFGEE